MSFRRVLCAFAWFFAWPAAAADPPPRPHIVYIVSDDQGWKDVGFHGSDIQTPNLDELARGGAKLEQFYAQPMCTPSRAALLTGRYPHRYGLQTLVIPSAGRYGLPTDERLLPQFLKEAGYEKGFTTTMAIRLGWAPHEMAATWMQREFENIGIKMNIVKETDATFRQSMSQGQHEISIDSWQSWVNDPFYHLQFNFNSKAAGTNVNFYSNPIVDKLIAENMHEPNLEKRNAASREIQKIIIEDAVWGFLWYDNWTRVMKSDIFGLEKRWDTFERYQTVYRKG